MTTPLTIGQVAEVLRCLVWNAWRKSSYIAMQGTLWDAAILAGEPRPANGTWLNPNSTLPVEVLVFPVRVMADLKAWRGLLGYVAELPEAIRALPDVVRLRELAERQNEELQS